MGTIREALQCKAKDGACAEVVRIDKATANRFIEAKHYRRTLGIFWEGFALVEDGFITGVVTYGQPSPAIQKHAFANRDFRIYELTRLVIQSENRNASSILISRSLNMLKHKPCAVISYADSAMGHCGIVYQATNWIYTGEVKAHDCMYLVDGEVLHSKTIQDRYGVTAPAKWAKENGIERIPPKKKYRYFYFVGTKREKRLMSKKLMYGVVSDYPKCDKQMYDDGDYIYHHTEYDFLR